MCGPSILAVLLLPVLGQGSDGRSAPSPGKLPVLTSVAAIRQLTREEARRGYPVRIRGVITFKVPVLLYVQDETGAIYVSPDNTPPSTKKLTPGTLVEVEGVTAFLRFSPTVRGCQGGPVQLKVLGRAPLPEPLRLSLDQLADPSYQHQWIEVYGVVRDVSSQLYPASPDFEEVIVTLGSASDRVKAVMFRNPPTDSLPRELIGAGVRVRGIFNAIINDKGQFLGMWLANSSLDDFHVERPSPGKPFELPVRPIASLMHFDAERSVSQRVRVQAIVTQVMAGRGMYVQGEDAGILVNTVDPPSTQPGDRVDIAGFLAHGDWNPVLEDAIYQTRGTGLLPEPLAIATEEALGGDYDCRRVVMEGLLVQASPSAQQPMLVLRSAETIFQASFAESTDLCLLAAVAEGSWLRVEGICVNRRGKDLLKESPPGLQERPRPAAFHLLLASPADVTVLRKPPWWNMRRVLVALGAILVVALAAIAWVAVLRYRVAVQTQIIRQQLAREAVYEERGRIARELHDTLEQVLGGISFHLHAVDKNLPHAPQSAQQVLGVARSLLEYSRAEARRSVADLRASLLEDGDLAAALRAVAAQAQDGTTTAVEAIVEGEPRRLPGRVEASLLRIAQEALTNALKHGKPSRVEFKLAFNHEDVILRISDDGTGFEVEQAATADGGHFGLLGMRERAEKIQASFAIHSMPGQGTEILVAVKT